MDPLHPIVPLAPNIPPVTPAPMTGRVDRDTRRGDTQERRRDRRKPDPAAPGLQPAAPDRDDDDGLHISVIA